MLNHDGATNIIQAMPFVEGLIGVTSGTVTGITVIHCVSDGSLTLTFPTGNTASVSMVEGADRTIIRGSSVEVVSGIFDFA